MAETEEHEKKEQSDPQATESAEQAAPERQAEVVTILDTELETLRDELQDWKQKYLLLLAESENTRKRLVKEKQSSAQFVLQDFILQFLQPIDNMENALVFADQMSDEVKNWAVGFKMILGQFKDSLAEQGVTPFDCVGNTFDPHRHEAVEMEETQDAEQDTITEQFSRGYIMGERVIRPARVKVAKSPSSSNSQEEQVDQPTKTSTHEEA
jgi:molecular chaperone GrpE